MKKDWCILMFIATLVAKEPIGETTIFGIEDDLRRAGLAGAPMQTLDEGRAWSIAIAGEPRQALEPLARVDGLDVFIRAADAPFPRLLIADMDSTMITCECIDELADYAGIKPAIAAITERAMRGELDFAAALAERVALLKGLSEDVIAQCLAERVRPTPGAEMLIRTLSARGARTVLVSGGFTRFAEPVGAMIGFDRVVANVLDIDGGRLTGKTLPPIIDSTAKLATLEAECAALGVTSAAAIAIGDGANDVPMLAGAGLGVAYRGHAAAIAAADASITHGDLTMILHALGVPKAEWRA